MGRVLKRCAFGGCHDSALACDSQDESKRLLGAGPELPNERFTSGIYEVTEDEHDDDRVVELPRDRDEVRYEVEGRREVGDESEQEEFAATWDAGFSEKASDEDDAVRDERGERPRILMTPANHEPGHEGGPDENEGTERDEEPFPPLHAVQAMRDSDAQGEVRGDEPELASTPDPRAASRDP